jgi:hypothetical protein
MIYILQFSTKIKDIKKLFRSYFAVYFMLGHPPLSSALFDILYPLRSAGSSVGLRLP